MEIKIIDSLEQLQLFKAEWECILRVINNNNAFLEMDWVSLWWKFFGHRHELFILVILEDKKVVGICPLMKSQKRIYSEIAFIGGNGTDSMGFVVRDEYREEVLKHICDFLMDLKGNNIIRLNSITEKSASYIALNKYIKTKKIPLVSNVNVRYSMDIENDNFGMLMERRFSKKTKETMINKEKKLKRLGELSYSRISTNEMDEVFEIHDKRWARKIGNSSFSKGETKEYYKELALSKNTKFEVTVDTISLNNRIISFLYGLEYKRNALFIRIGHDDDFFFLSPGELVLKKRIEQCFKSKIQTIDFGQGYEPYKAKWSDNYEEVYEMIFPSDNLQSRLIFYTRYWARIKLVNILKKNKSIYTFKKYTLGKIKFLFSRVYISNRILKVKTNVAQQGLTVYLWKHFTSIMKAIFSYNQYLILGKYLTYMEIPQDNLQIAEAGIDDLEALSTVMGESSSSIIRRFAVRNKCLVVFDNNRIVGYCWINCSNMEVSHVELDMPLRKSEAYIYDFFCEKKYKNKDDYKLIFSEIFKLLYNENYRRCYMVIAVNGNSNERELLKNIFHPRFTVYEKRLFNKIEHRIIERKTDKTVKRNEFDGDKDY